MVGVMLTLKLLSNDCVGDNVSVSSSVQEIAVEKTALSTSLHKKVRFDCSQNKIHPNTQFSKAEIRQMDLWYQREELRMFKKATVTWAERIAKFESKNQSPSSYGNVIERLYQSCDSAQSDSLSLKDLLVSCGEREQLCHWAGVATTRYGVETLAFHSIRADRCRRRGELLREIAKVQEEYDPFFNDLDDLLHQASQRISKTSRLFSAAIAEASAASFLEW